MQETPVSARMAAGAEHAPEETNEKHADELKAEAFERLIRGEYKAEFDERVKKIIDKRFREMRGMKEQAARVKPLMEALLKRYGETDAERLIKLLSEETEAARPSEDNRAKMAMLRALAWHSEAQSLTSELPDFDLKKEMADENFKRLLKAGVDMKTAYRALHQNEILESAVRYAAEKVREHTVREMRKNAMRPGENGAGGQGGMRMSPMSVGNMTKAQREEIERRSQRGEKVYLS